MMINIQKVYKQILGVRIVFVAIAIALMYWLFHISPDIKFPLVTYKLTLVTVGAILGYVLDMALFPNFRPKDIAEEIDSTTDETHLHGLYRVASASVLRRAVIVGASILALCLGL